jgi:thiol-disulfide isomerase/thioredoxin
MRLGTIVGIAVCLSLATSAFGQRNKLKVGDTAPGLDIEEWVKGEETTIEEGKTYIVEFWATWCGPCKRSIPHLTKLQKEHGSDGLTIIGVSSEEADKVKPFVRKQSDKMDYTVAVDRRNSTKRSWFEAAGLKGIPAAFVVDQQGKIAWIGNPLSDDFDPVVQRVLNGRYNPKLEKEAAPMLRAAEQARKVRNWRMAQRHYDEVIELDWHSSGSR